MDVQIEIDDETVTKIIQEELSSLLYACESSLEHLNNDVPYVRHFSYDDDKLERKSLKKEIKAIKYVLSLYTVPSLEGDE